MAKNYDEASVLKELAKKCTVDYAEHLIRVNPNGNCGNGTWGKIDFLTNHCGWRVIKDNTAKIGNDVQTSNVKKHKNDEPKEEHKLTNKKK